LPSTDSIAGDFSLLRARLFASSFVVCVLFAGSALRADVVISEFLASNSFDRLDEDGDSSDWIEIHNEHPFAVDLEGWCLTDDVARPSQWCFPSFLLDPGAYLVVFASGKDRTNPDNPFHTNFELDAGGEYLGLLRPDGTVATEFAPEFPSQRRDISYGLGERVDGDPLVGANHAARVFVPANDALGSTWTGDPRSEPFDDSDEAGWRAANIGVGYASDPGPDLPDPLAYWTFDGTVDDLSGNGHAADLRGAVYDNLVPPVIAGGQSLRFSGSADYVSVVIDVSEGNYTSAFWFRADTSSRGLFCVVDNDLGGGGHDRHLYLNGTNLASRVWNNETITSQGRDYVDGDWHHVAHVVGPAVGGQRIYVDGQLVATGAKAGSDFDWQKRVNIGFSNDAGSDFFDGLIDDVAIWSEALSPEQVVALAAGASPLRGSGVGPFVETDLANSLRGVSSSLYVRIPFSMDLPLDAESLRLRVRYDDGYAAFLNGVELVRRNAPDPLRWDSRALVDRPLTSAVRNEDIDVSSGVEHLRAGTNVLALHALNDRAGSEDFLLAPQLLRVERVGARFFQNPTAGEPNDAEGVSGFVRDTRFSVDRGIYSDPVDVVIESDTEDAVIRYTLDGSEPSATSGLVYSDPIRISRTTVLRAAAYKSGLGATNVDTHTYIFPDDVVDQGVMLPDITSHGVYGPQIAPALAKIPSVSIVTRLSINTGSEVEASVELILPDGSEGFQEHAGIKKVGGHSLNFPKNNMRLYFRRKYGPGKLDYPLFRDAFYSEGAAEKFDQLDLRGGSHDSIFYLGANQQLPSNAQYARNRWMSDTLHEMGQVSNHGRYVQVYINGTYWGHYQIQERPTRAHVASYLGGDEDDFESVNSGRTIGSASPAWAHIATIRGNYNEVKRWVDVESLVDYMLLNFYAGNAWDWTINHNWMAAGPSIPDRGGYQFFSWDADITLRRLNDYNLNQPGPGGLFRDLLPHAEFRRLVGDRIHRHFYNDGVLTPARVDSMFRRRAEQVYSTIVAETARWRWAGIVWTRDNQWEAEFVRLCSQFFPQRTGIVLDQIAGTSWYPDVPAPEFLVDGARQHDGDVRSGAELSVVVPGFERVVETTIVSIDAPRSAYVPRNGNLGNDWRLASYVEGSRGETWREGAGGVGYENGAGYQTLIDIDVGPEMTNDPGNPSVLVRVPFKIDDAAEVARIGELALKIHYDDGFAAYLNGVRVAAANAPAEGDLTWNSLAKSSHEATVDRPDIFDIDAFRDELRTGENLLAIHGLNFSQVSSDMVIHVELVGRQIEAGAAPGVVAYTLDGSDPMEEGALDFESPLTVDESVLVKARSFDGEEWSALNEALFVVPGSFPLRVTEIMYHPPDPAEGSPFGSDDFEFFELQNISGENLDLDGVRVRHGIRFDFSTIEDRILGPGEHVLLVNNLEGFASIYDTDGLRIAGEYDGRLGNGGERILISGPLGETILDFEYDDVWYPSTDGLGHSLVITDVSLPVDRWAEAQSWRPSANLGGSPGAADEDDGAGGFQRPGDANQDGRIGVSDAVRLLLILFRGATPPCEGDLASPVLDVDGDASVNVTDAVHLLTYLYGGGAPPSAGTRCVRVEGCDWACVP